MSSSFIRSHLIIPGLAAAAFIGYCIYFDYRRRSAPDYKQKIRENRRRRARKLKDARPRPDPTDPSSIQAFFLQEVQLGEEMISEGHSEEGIDHLCNAITMCGQPTQLLQIFQQTLSGDQFSLLLQKLPEAKARMMRMFGASLEAENERAPRAVAAGAEANQPQGLIDSDDLE